MNISRLGKVNLFIGPNNCGKSNILKAIEKALNGCVNEESGHAVYDRPNKEKTSKFEFDLRFIIGPAPDPTEFDKNVWV